MVRWCLTDEETGEARDADFHGEPLAAGVAARVSWRLRPRGSPGRGVQRTRATVKPTGHDLAA